MHVREYKPDQSKVSFKQVIRPGDREITIIFTGTVNEDELQVKRELRSLPAGH